MASSNENEDSENPTILTAPKKQESYWQRSPVDGVMFTAAGFNMVSTCMFTYALSGNLRMAQFLSLFAIPASIVSTIVDSKSDYENWKKTQNYREKGLPEKFMPYKVKYDWSKFDEDLKARNLQPRFTGSSGNMGND
ncbi:hypothetical protein M3Y97_00229600 [Aphelenchoides bicaudatus]|nr:hypothetical protein M3Y97_00229600 [Aphelenchoides bicaudatus]